MTDLELAAHIANHYGHCVLGAACFCNHPKRVWLGTTCLHWRPVSASNWDELRTAMLAEREVAT